MSEKTSKYSDDPEVRKLLAELIADGEETSDELRTALVEGGDEVGRALRKLGADEKMAEANAPGGGWAVVRALELLGERREEEAVDLLVEWVVRAEPGEIVYEAVITALQKFGPPAVESVLAAVQRAEDESTRHGLANILAYLGVRDDRILEVLLDVLDEEPPLGAILLSEYGDTRGKDAIHDAFSQMEIDEESSLLEAADIREMEDALERMGGELTAEEQTKVEKANRVTQRGRDSSPSIFAKAPPEDGPPLELTSKELEAAKKGLARQRRRLRRGAKRKVQKALKSSRYKVVRSVVNEEWREDRLAALAQVRARPDGTFLMAFLLVDLGCMGPKDGFLGVFSSLEEVDEELDGYAVKSVDCSPQLAAKIVERGALLAAHLGFSIPQELFAPMAIFDRFDAAKAKEEVPLGSHRKPLYVAREYDDIDAILDHLDERVGPEGYEFVGARF